MNVYENHIDYQDHYEYHGNTTIEITRKSSGRVIMRDWILFDTIDEAQTFFNDSATEHRGSYV